MFGSKFRGYDKVTAIIEQGDDGWLVGQLKEFPAVIHLAETLEELEKNLLSGLQFYLEVQADLTTQEYEGRTYTQESLVA
ncbi:MAG: type II toxin-antitoxin system HicB family antitoxin [Hymenobacter sp.]